MDESIIAKFWSWFSEQQDTLFAASPENATDSITEEIQKIHPEIGVEVGSTGSTAELIVTAFGNRELFDDVHTIVDAAPVLRSWQVISLKPPGGFDFRFTLGSLSVNCASIPFVQIEAEGEADLTGIRLYLPIKQQQSERFSNVGRLILATGLGEETFASVDFFDVADSSQAPPGPLLLPELPAFLRWVGTKRHNRAGG